MPEYETQDFQEVADALQDILEQHKDEGWQDLEWHGPDKLHYSIAAVCPEPSGSSPMKDVTMHRTRGVISWKRSSWLPFNWGIITAYAERPRKKLAYGDH